MTIVAEKTNFLFLLGVVITTGFIGIWLAKMQGKMHLQKIQEELGAGRLPGNPLIEGLMILVAAAVLITPGFITDALGFLLLVPYVRKLIAPKLSGFFKPKMTKSSGSFTFFTSSGQSSPFQGGAQHSDTFDMPQEPTSEPEDKHIEHKE